MEREITLHDCPSLLHMDKTDFECIITVIQQFKDSQADILGITVALKQMGFITERKSEQIVEMCHGRNDISFPEYIVKIITEVSFEQLCCALDKTGRIDIATKLRNEKYTHLYQKPLKKKMPYTKKIHIFYKNQKSIMDNNCYREGKPGKRKILRNQIAEYDKTIMLSEDRKQQELAVERKTTSLVLLMQLYKNPGRRRLILEQAVRTESNGLDNTSLVLTYHSKMAVTEAFLGNKAAAAEHATQAKVLCENTAPCFAVVSALHDFLVMNQVLFSDEPTEDMLEKVMKEGENALLCLMEVPPDVQIIWRRIILLLMVMSLLHITLGLKVERRFPIKKENIERAKEILKDIEKASDNIELRRQMVKCLCHGVIMEEEDTKVAEVYIQAAEEKARDGGYFHTSELHNIEQYHAELNTKLQALPSAS